MKIKLVLLSLLFFTLPGYAAKTILARDGVQSALLSPDGQHIALLNRVGDVDQLLIVSKEKKNTAHSRKEITPRRILSIAWIDDDRLALQLGADAIYQSEPQPTGQIEVLKIDGESTLIGIGNDGATVVQKALTEKQLTVGDGLASIPGRFLVIDQNDRYLWRVDLVADSIETLEHPPFRISSLAVSPNAQYMAAAGVSDDGKSRAMVWRGTDDRGWRDSQGNPEFIAIDDAGIATAIIRKDSGVAGLVSVSIDDDSRSVLYQHESVDVDQVMVDGSNRPFAARVVPGFPKWFYFGDAHRSTKLHRSFRTAWPQSDISFVSSSTDGGTIIAKRSDDDFPSSFFVVDTVLGKADRLLDSKSGLSMVGGDEDDAYELTAIEFESTSGAKLSGYISLPQAESDKERPTVVLLRDKSDESKWQWGFNEETWFFHRQGFNVLMLNGNPTSGIQDSSSQAVLKARISDVEEAIDWSVQQGYTDKKRICLFGRGTGAEMALLAALGNTKFDCVISLGGTFEDPDLVAEIAQDKKRRNRRLQALLVYGTDDGSQQLALQDKVRESLTSVNITVDTMPVMGERRIFSSRTNEVRAYAKISYFLGEFLDRRTAWPTLPLIYEQALAMNALHEALVVRLDEGRSDARDLQRWFDANDAGARNTLFEEQLPLYESYREQIIAMSEGKVGQAFARFGPIRRNTGTRAGGRPGSD